MLENVLLLSCRSPFLEDSKVYPPLANLYLQAAIQKKHPEVKVTVSDEYDLNNPEWTKQFDGIGISIMTPQRSEARKLLSLIKSNSSALVFAGGPHVKYYFKEEESNPWDHLVTHDGLRAINQIIEGKAPRVMTDLISLVDYPSEVVKPERLKNAAFLREYNYKLKGEDSTTMLTAQGCSEWCTFCEDAGTNVRFTPFQMVKQELDDIVSLGYKGIYIFDDIFSISRKTTEPMAKEIQKRGLIYRANGQARLMNEDFMRMLADTGCVELAFGAETGSQEILNKIRKRTTVAQNYQFVEWANKYKIHVKAFLMLGLPGESLDTIAQTEEFIQSSGIDDFQLSIYYPYKGTQIRDAIDQGKGTIDLKFEGEGLGAYGQKGGQTECVVRTASLTREDLLFQRDRLVKLYRPTSHSQRWSAKPQTDHFFDTHLKEGGY